MHAYVVADVFTDTPLEGNAVAVFTKGSDVQRDRMQRIAREMNLSETVFVLPAEGAGHARIRIFTPTTELPFAGHPTLGTAIVLGEQIDEAVIRLETGAGLVPVRLDRAGGKPVFGRMQQPIPRWEPYERAGEVLGALGLDRSGLPVEAYRNGPLHVFVALDDVEQVAALQPDLARLAPLREVGVNCFAGAGKTWKTRMFAPALGVAEDPATGSAAGPLAVHLSRHGRISFGDEIEIKQGAEVGRPSTLYARAEGSGDRVVAVEVAGSAVIVARGELHV